MMDTVGRWAISNGVWGWTEIKLHNFGNRTAQRFTRGLSNCRMFRNYFGRSWLRNGSKRMNFTHNWIRWGNGCKFLVTDRDMRRIKMPIVLSLNTCISLYTLCTRCRTATFWAFSELSLWLWTVGSGWHWELGALSDELRVSCNDCHFPKTSMMIDAMRNAYLRFFG